MFNRAASGICDRRHRKQPSWTSFESPFFGSAGRNKKESEGDSKDSSDWSPSLMTDELKTTNSTPSTPAAKQSGKSVATATTASASTGTNSGGGNLHSPTLTEDLHLGDRAGVFQGTTTKTPPVLNMDNLPRVGMSNIKGAHRGLLAMKQPKKEPPVSPETKLDETVLETSFSDDESGPTSVANGLSRRNSPQDPCMPMVIEDLREMVATSVAKTLCFFNQVSTFCHDGSTRRNNTGGINRPTTVFIIPKSRNKDQVPFDESLGGEAYLNPPLLTDNGADDMSSLTEPPGFLLEKTRPKLQRVANPSGTKGQSPVDPDKNGEEIVDFEPELVEISQLPGEQLFDDVLLGMIPVESMLPPSLFTTLEPPLIASNKAKLSNPFEDLKSADPSNEDKLSNASEEAIPSYPSNRSDPLPVLADKISEVSTDISIADPRFRFPFADFRPRTRKDHSYLAAVRNEYQSQGTPPEPPPLPPREQVNQKKSPTSVQVIWGNEVPKPGIARSLRQLKRLRIRNCDLESVEC